LELTREDEVDEEYELVNDKDISIQRNTELNNKTNKELAKAL
ncbi:34742_t:CDS:1, partial [Gigaspora margarita]